MVWQRAILVIFILSAAPGLLIGAQRVYLAAEINYQQHRHAEEYQAALSRLRCTPAEVKQTKQLIHEMRRYRIRLLGLKRSAEASDDDLEAAMWHGEIEQMDELILEAESLLSQAMPRIPNAHLSLPGGLEEGLVLYYRFDEGYGSRVIDASEHENHAVVTGARWSKHGRRGGAYWFDGIDDHIQATVNPSLDLDQALTLSLFVYRQSADKLNPMNVEHLWSLGQKARSDLVLFLAPGGGIGADIDSKTLTTDSLLIPPEPAKWHVADDRWVHLVLTYNGQRVRLYIDGRADKVKLITGSLGVSHGTLNIGRMGNGQWQYGFKGKLDDVILWNRVLTEVEVLGLWTALQRSHERARRNVGQADSR